MKKIILSTTLTILSIVLYGQNAFHEAKFLGTISKVDLENISKFAELEKPAFNLSKQEIESVKNYKLFIENPFNDTISQLNINLLSSAISKYNKHIEFQRQAVLLVNTSEYLDSSGIISALSLVPNILGGNFSLSQEQQTNIIDGLSKYYAEEFRKAQLLTYMQTMEKTIGKVGELQILFPQTYSKLKSTDPSRFPEFGNEYKSIFNEDLKMIITNLINHIDNQTDTNKIIEDSKLKWLNSKNVSTIKSNEFYDCFKITADASSKLINNYHPVDLFNYIDNTYYDSNILTKNKLEKSDYIKLTFHGINLIQRNILDTTKTNTSQFANVWLSLQDLKRMNTKDEWLFFSGLVYQQDGEFFDKYIFTATGKNVSDITDENIKTFKARINLILASLVEIQNFRNNLNEESLKENFSEYMKLILKSLESASNFSTESFQIAPHDLKKYLEISDYTIKIYDNARKKDYSNTIYYAAEILNQLLGSNPTYNEVLTSIDQYGSFMIDVINSKDSDEVKELIKKHAAPPTSFVLKRQYNRTFSITGQPGYFVSIEKLKGQNQEYKFVSGITLPIGFEFTQKIKWGKDNVVKERGSIGIFAQIIDLGAVLNFRVGDSTSTLPDQINFGQIFSPGGSINYGFKNSPVTLGLGYQYSPQLRQITDNGNDLFPNGHRIFFRLAWDIPLVNIARSKSK